MTDGKVLEGTIEALSILPLLRLAGFYRVPNEMRMEQEIDRINIEDEDISITGRLDLIYQLLPSLHLIEPESSEKLLQVLKAICKVQNGHL